MKTIGLLSDTHGFIDLQCLEFFQDVDEIWHAGDIGSIEVLNKLESFKPVRAVFGNCDDYNMRLRTKEHLRFFIEDLDVWMTHIGGYPGKYAPQVIEGIKLNPPKLFISGHSHILKVINDPKLNLLHINPGAIGNIGIHSVKTAIKFEIIEGKVQNLQIFEKKRKSIME